MSGGSSTPATPDYVSAANATAAGNLQLLNAQTAANRPNQYNPMGSSTWQQDGNGNWTQTTSLNPQYQALLNGQTSAAQTALGQYSANQSNPLMDPNYYLNTQMNLQGNGQGLMSQISNQSAQGQQYLDQQKAIADRAQGINGNSVADALMQRMQPQLGSDRNALSASLAAQGLTLGSNAYNTNMELQNQKENDAYLAAQVAGVNAAQTEMQTAALNSGMYGTMFNENQNTVNNLQGLFSDNNTLMGQNLNAGQYAAASKAAPLSQYTALMTGAQSSTPQFTNFTNAGAGSAADIAGALSQQYSADLNSSNASKAGNTATGAAVGTAAGAAVGSVVPVVGTLAGAGVGGALGGLVGSWF